MLWESLLKPHCHWLHGRTKRLLEFGKHHMAGKFSAILGSKAWNKLGMKKKINASLLRFRLKRLFENGKHRMAGKFSAILGFKQIRDEKENQCFLVAISLQTDSQKGSLKMESTAWQENSTQFWASNKLGIKKKNNASLLRFRFRQTHKKALWKWKTPHGRKIQRNFGLQTN